eukprot:TRINITY_DN12122_c0_g1_i1.p1 TRINITY_DN12122_c0_g1~~TRINITY_DN12122_c0_g1_i1.p1  ORF type:complete len:271 (-),score=46.28 TRINITY_DN12122_c0_g1_i1:34-732(-)
MATASSDNTTKVFSTGENPALMTELKGHEGPVLSVAWADPKFGSILATASHDHCVLVWQEVEPNAWEIAYRHTVHTSSVCCVAWAPKDYGLVLGCGSSDGFISVLTLSEKPDVCSSAVMFHAHKLGVTSLSWAPADKGSGQEPGAACSRSHDSKEFLRKKNCPHMRLVSGGCDHVVRIWKNHSHGAAWRPKQEWQQHKDWVRDVAWSPAVGVGSTTIATCSQVRVARVPHRV